MLHNEYKLKSEIIERSNVMLGTQIVQQFMNASAKGSPGAVNFNGEVVVAWADAGKDNIIHVIKSPSEGQWTRPEKLSEFKSPVGVSLAVVGKRLIMGWTSEPHYRLKLAESRDGQSWQAIKEFNNSGYDSFARPGLTEHNGHLVVARVGSTHPTERKINLTTFDETGGWTANRILGEQSTAAPALASFDGKLFMAWAGKHNPWPLCVTYSEDLGKTWADTYVSPDHCPDGPHLLVYSRKLYYTWTGRVDRTINIFGSRDAHPWDEEPQNQRKIVRTESLHSPVLLSAYEKPAVVWTGTGNDTPLNFAVLNQI